MMAELIMSAEPAEEKKQKQQRRGRMMTMLAAGVAMGAMTAFIMRRRRQREWEEHEANAAMERAELAETGTGMTAGGTGSAWSTGDGRAGCMALTETVGSAPPAVGVALGGPTAAGVGVRTAHWAPWGGGVMPTGTARGPRDPSG